jgi:hypothetical protein
LYGRFPFALQGGQTYFNNPNGAHDFIERFSGLRWQLTLISDCSNRTLSALQLSTRHFGILPCTFPKPPPLKSSELPGMKARGGKGLPQVLQHWDR